MKIKCIDSTNCLYLQVGKLYECNGKIITAGPNKCYKIVNDLGKESLYTISRFEVVPELTIQEDSNPCKQFAVSGTITGLKGGIEYNEGDGSYTWTYPISTNEKGAEIIKEAIRKEAEKMGLAIKEKKEEWLTEAELEERKLRDELKDL
jgi:hypothetical protein